MPSKETLLLQPDMFTGKLHDTRTRTQKRQARQRQLPQQLHLFTDTEIIEQARSRFTQPWMVTRSGKPLDLALMIEDPRSEEEIEADRIRLAQEQTYSLLGDGGQEQTEVYSQPSPTSIPTELTTSFYGQYDDLKHQFPQAIVFFRSGDVYQTFNEDAEIAARELDIVLVDRRLNDQVQVPTIGVPHETIDSCVVRLIEKGYDVVVGDDRVGGGEVSHEAFG